MKKVVIAGSVSLQDKIEYWKKFWESNGNEVINYPIPLGSLLEEYSSVHKQFFKSIIDTDILFIMNEDKKETEGYVGAEVFAEMNFGVIQNLVYGRNIEIILLKSPSSKVQSFDEIELWLKLGWINLLNK